MKQYIKLFIVTVVILIVLIMCNNNLYFEHLTILSNESLQNLGSVYNNSNLKISNINVTSDATIENNANVGNNVNVGKDFEVSGNEVIHGSSTIKKKLIVEDGAHIKKNIDVDESVNIKKDLNVDGTLKAITITGKGTSGRLHISGDELLFLLNKKGVIIGKEWGGNGNLSVQGNLNMNGGIFTGGIKVYDNIQASDGWDLAVYSNIKNNNECVTKCRSINNVRMSLFNKKEKNTKKHNCWCKGQNTFRREHDHFTSTSIY